MGKILPQLGSRPTQHFYFEETVTIIMMCLLGFNSTQKSATDIIFKVDKKKKPTDLFPRVPRTDLILLIVRCHGEMRVCSRPMGCKITTLIIDRSNVSTSHRCPKFLATSLVRHLLTRPPSFSDFKNFGRLVVANRELNISRHKEKS